MPTLKWSPPEGAPRAFALFKPVSTVGRALGNDVAVTSPGLADTHVQVLFDGREFNLEEVDKQGEILINGKKNRRARLVHGDRLRLGDAEFVFSIFDDPPAQVRRAAPSGGDVAHASAPAPSTTDLQGRLPLSLQVPAQLTVDGTPVTTATPLLSPSSFTGGGGGALGSGGGAGPAATGGNQGLAGPLGPEGSSDAVVGF